MISAVKKPSKEPVLKIRKNSGQIRKREKKRSEKNLVKEHKPGTPFFNETQAQEGSIKESNAVLQKEQNGH